MEGKVCIVKGITNTIKDYEEVEIADVKAYLKTRKWNCCEITLPINFEGRTAEGLNRPYVDLDGKIPADWTEEQYKELTDKIANELKTLFPNEFLMSSSQHKARKLSYRIHYQNVCGTHKAVKLFVENSVVPLFENWNACLFGTEHKTQTAKPYLELDLTIYNKHRKMRMLGCNKDYKDAEGKRQMEDRPLVSLREPTDADFTNSLITYTKDCVILPETLPKKPKEKVVPVDETEDEDPIEDVMKQVLDGLNETRCDTKSYWLNVGMALKGSALPFEIWDEWSKKSKKYKDGECLKLWNEWTNIYNKTQTSIWAYLKNDNPELYNKLINKRTDLRLLLQDKYSDTKLAEFIYNLNPHEYMNGNIGWYVIDKTTNIWKANGNELPRGIGKLIHDTFEPITTSFIEMYEEANKNPKLTEGGKMWNEQKIQELKKFQHYVGQNKTHNQVLPQLKNFYYIEDLEGLIDNKQQHLIPFSDGTCYDLKAKSTRRIVPDDYISITTGYAYPQQSNPEIRQDILKILRSIWECDKMVLFMLWAISLSLYGKNNLEWFFLWTGRGGNGKGLLTDLIIKAFGGFFVNVPIGVLTQATKDKDEKNNYLKDTRGRRYFSSQEPEENAVFVGGQVKTLTGGDILTIRGIHEKPVSFVPAFTMTICVNTPPLITGFGESIKRRCVVIPFPFQFKDAHSYDATNKFHRKRDTTIKEQKFGTTAYRDEFMLMLIEAYDGVKDGKEKPPMVVSKTNEYTNANNPLAEWLESDYTKDLDTSDKSKWILANALWNDYKSFSGADGDMTIRKFIALMTDVNEYSKIKQSNNFKVNGENRDKGVYIQGIVKKQNNPVEEEEAEPVVEVVRRRNIFEDY